MSTREQDLDRDPAHQAAEGADGGGQVSEVSLMDGAEPDPIQPDQSVAGSSDDQPGQVDEGPQGPNADPNPGARRT